MARIDVRIARPEDARRAAEAAALIRKAARNADIAVRKASMLREKIASGRAVLAIEDDVLVGFGYFSEWEGGRFVSHSGLVVADHLRGRGIGRRLKARLMQASRRRFPAAITLSLTTSPAVEAMTRSLGFVRVPLSRLTKDPEFWKGCLTCRNYAEVRRRGDRCCCFGMILDPRRVAPASRGSRAPRRRR